VRRVRDRVAPRRAVGNLTRPLAHGAQSRLRLHPPSIVRQAACGLGEASKRTRIADERGVPAGSGRPPRQHRLAASVVGELGVVAARDGGGDTPPGRIDDAKARPAARFGALPREQQQRLSLGEAQRRRGERIDLRQRLRRRGRHAVRREHLKRKRPERLCQRADGAARVLLIKSDDLVLVALARELGLLDPLNCQLSSDSELARINLNGCRVRVAAQRKDLGLQLIEGLPERGVGRQPLHELSAQRVFAAAPAWESGRRVRVMIVDVVEVGVVLVVAGIRPHGAKCLGYLVDRRGKRQKLTQLLPKSRSAVLGLHTNACPGALDDGADSFDYLMLEAHVVALLQVHRG